MGKGMKTIVQVGTQTGPVGVSVFSSRLKSNEGGLLVGFWCMSRGKGPFKRGTKGAGLLEPLQQRLYGSAILFASNLCRLKNMTASTRNETRHKKEKKRMGTRLMNKQNATSSTVLLQCYLQALLSSRYSCLVDCHLKEGDRLTILKAACFGFGGSSFRLPIFPPLYSSHLHWN